MANVTVSITVGATSVSWDINPTDTRTIEFLDDLIGQHYNDQDPLPSRQEAAQQYVDGLGAGIVSFAQGLKQRRLNAGVGDADDLTGA